MKKNDSGRGRKSRRRSKNCRRTSSTGSGFGSDTVGSGECYGRGRKLLAALIYCEAGNQPYEGQVAVGAVVMNRVRSGSYPNTISEVIYQSGQFGPAMTGWA